MNAATARTISSRESRADRVAGRDRDAADRAVVDAMAHIDRVAREGGRSVHVGISYPGRISKSAINMAISGLREKGYRVDDFGVMSSGCVIVSWSEEIDTPGQEGLPGALVIAVWIATLTALAWGLVSAL